MAPKNKKSGSKNKKASSSTDGYQQVQCSICRGFVESKEKLKSHNIEDEEVVPCYEKVGKTKDPIYLKAKKNLEKKAEAHKKRSNYKGKGIKSKN